jgi:prolyl oligopeptidase
LPALLILAPVALAIDPPPPTERKPVSDTLFGATLTDPYRWLETQDAPETRAWIAAQNAYTDRYLATLAGRDVLRARLTPFFRIDSVGSPVERNGRYYFTRRLAGENRSSICVRQGLAGKDEVLIAPDSISQDSSVSISMGPVSRNGSLMLFHIRKGGEDETEIRFLDLNSRKEIADRMPRSRWFGTAFTRDAKGLYYSRPTRDGTRVFFHVFGTPVESDKIIFGLGKGMVPFDSVSISEDGRWLILVLAFGSTTKNEVRLMDLEKGGPPVTVVEGIDAQFNARVFDNRLYIVTNWKAPNRRVLATDAANPSLEKAREIIAERPSVLNNVSLVGGRIYAAYLEDVKTKVRVFDRDGKPLGDFPTPGPGPMFGPSGRWDSEEAFFTYSSFEEPATVYRVDLKTGRQDVWWRAKLPVQPGEIETEQVWYTSKDGTKVPMWLVHRKGLSLDGNRPVYLTGYGGFNISELPSFSSTAILWAQLGGVYALPNLRGGGEFGEKWHEAGMLDRKQNVFDDFIAAAEWLIAHKYTRPARLAIAGGSNGGLLVGAALTQRPDLFGAVHCSVPLLDMVRYHNLLLGRFWVPEYGSSENEAQFRTLLAYSPYQKVEKGKKYPPVLFSSGDSDTRVDPMHARKMTALLQAESGSGKPVVLKYDTKAGHSGGKPVDKEIEDAADVQLFLLNQLGVDIK